MALVDELPAVRRGLWLYAGTTPCDVRIVRHHVLFGTGDADDPPSLADDQPMDCFYVRYHTPAAAPVWLDGGAGLSLREAVFLAERKLGPVVNWQD